MSPCLFRPHDRTLPLSFTPQLVCLLCLVRILGGDGLFNVATNMAICRWFGEGSRGKVYSLLGSLDVVTMLGSALLAPVVEE